MERAPTLAELFKRSPNFAALTVDKEVTQLIARANSEYLHWDKFRYLPVPKGFTSEDVWTMVKLARHSEKIILPINDERGQPFSIVVNKSTFAKAIFFDQNTFGALPSQEGITQKSLVMNGLIEEAISSSQIEGANTTRKVAKAMLETNRAPKTPDEKMILNNFLAMQAVEGWGDRSLNDKFLLELHDIMTQGPLKKKEEEGRFRNDSDEIVVNESMTGETVHIPPNDSHLSRMLKEMYDFANKEQKDLHPFVKATILHFLMGYIHPYVDGNGRCARALFYWFMLKANYTLFKYMPVSLQIRKKQARPGYDKAYLSTETDENDITYFLNYNFKIARQAVDDLHTYLERRKKEAKALEKEIGVDVELNDRQLEILDFFERNPDAVLELKDIMEKFEVVYQTARTDMLNLVAYGLIRRSIVERKFLFMARKKRRAGS